MRKSLMESFNQIYILDLHGNSKRRERAPDGSVDENVFDIEQGVAIALFVKSKDLESGVWHSELWGKRLHKYKSALASSKKSISWKQLEPGSPDWLFRPQDKKLAQAYRTYWSMPQIFSASGRSRSRHRNDARRIRDLIFVDRSEGKSSKISRSERREGCEK